MTVVDSFWLTAAGACDDPPCALRPWRCPDQVPCVWASSRTERGLDVAHSRAQRVGCLAHLRLLGLVPVSQPSLLAPYITPNCQAPHHTTPHHTIPHRTTQYHTAPHHTTPHHTTLHHTTPHHTTPHNTTQHNTTQHNTTQHNTTHNTTQHNTTPHNTTQHNTTQHNTTPSLPPLLTGSFSPSLFSPIWRSLQLRVASQGQAAQVQVQLQVPERASVPP